MTNTATNINEYVINEWKLSLVPSGLLGALISIVFIVLLGCFIGNWICKMKGDE